MRIISLFGIAAAVLSPLQLNAASVHTQDASLDVKVSAASEFLPDYTNARFRDEDSYCYEDDGDGGCRFGSSESYKKWPAQISLSSSVHTEFSKAKNPIASEFLAASYMELRGELGWKNDTSIAQLAMWEIVFDLVIDSGSPHGRTEWAIMAYENSSHNPDCSAFSTKPQSGVISCSSVVPAFGTLELRVETLVLNYVDSDELHPLPLPGALTLLSAGLGGLALVGRARTSRTSTRLAL